MRVVSVERGLRPSGGSCDENASQVLGTDPGLVRKAGPRSQRAPPANDFAVAEKRAGPLRPLLSANEVVCTTEVLWPLGTGISNRTREKNLAVWNDKFWQNVRIIFRFSGAL